MTIQPRLSSSTTTHPVFQSGDLAIDQAALRQQATRLITGFWVSQIIQTAARFSLFNLLQAGPIHADDLAAMTGTQPDALRRLLLALAAIDVVRTTDHETFALSPLGTVLINGMSGALGDFAIMICDPWCWRSWGELPITVQTGQPTYQRRGFPTSFVFMDDDPEQTLHFNRAMLSFCRQFHEAVGAAYDFSRFATLVDVGGGHGSFVSVLLPQYPDLHAQVLDLPHVVEGTNVRMQELGLSDRCVGVAGSFFQSVPTGADAYLLSFILHDWDDTDCLTILRSIADAAEPGTTLLIGEMVLPDDPRANPQAYLMDINMLAATGGRERTAAEYAALLDATGFTLTQIVATTSPMSLLEAVRR